MRIFEAIVVLGVVLSIMRGASVVAHETGAHSGAGPAPGEVTEISLTIDPDGAPPVAEVERGLRIRLLLHGAGARELHFHGYDISVVGVEGSPAVFDFDATHSGRFAIEAHGVEDLLGRSEKPVAYVEVRGR